MSILMRCLHYSVISLGLLTAFPSWAMPTFEEYFASHPAPMWMIDVETGAIVRANTAAHAFYGYQDLESKNISNINLLSQVQIRQEIELARRQSRNHLFMRHRLADGTIKVVGIYTQPYEVDGREVLISSIYDTSEFESSAERHYIQSVEQQVDLQTAELAKARQRARWMGIAAALAQGLVILVLLIALRNLRRSKAEKEQLIDELSFRNRELERLSHVMAHHFQEPSRRLISFARQLQRNDSLKASPDDTLALHFIGTQAKRLSELVSDVQRYLSLDACAPRCERLNTQRLLEEIYDTDPKLNGMRDSDALEIVEPLPWVYADKKQVTLIFMTLLHNAWQYRNSQLPLAVKVSACLVGQRVRFSVADNGQGIAPEYRLQVFDMFSRLVPNSEAFPGTGMGLALVAKTLRGLNGNIRVEKGPQGGACFIFDLPAAEGGT